MSELLPDKPIFGMFTLFTVFLALGILYTGAMAATMATSKNLGTKIIAQIVPCIMFAACLGFFPKPAFPLGSVLYLGLLIGGIIVMVYFVDKAEKADSPRARARYNWVTSLVTLAIVSFCGYGFLQLFTITKAAVCLTASDICWALGGIALAYSVATFGYYLRVTFSQPRQVAEPA